jgi:protein-S-isoprenylcysteine O-methyltransferase Ste14
MGFRRLRADHKGHVTDSVRTGFASAQWLTRKDNAMSFGLYSVGFAIVIGGLTYAAHLAHVPTRWIVVGAIVLLGIGIVSGVKATRHKDPVG